MSLFNFFKKKPQNTNSSLEKYTPASIDFSTDEDFSLRTIDLMEGHEFEHWCADGLRELGFSNVEVTPGSGDHGVDILAKKDGVKYAIQCKRYNTDLGNTPVQEVHAGKSMYHCHVGVVLTNRYFTAGAKQLADATGTLLWDRDWIRSNFAHRLSVDNDSIPSEKDIEKEAEEDLIAGLAYALVHKEISIEILQQHFSLSHNRALVAINKMQEMQYIGSVQDGFTDQIYITEEKWNELRNHHHQKYAPIEVTTPQNAIVDREINDDLFCEAVETVLETQQASVSILQRRLNLGYAKAAKLIDLMESKQIVSPWDGSKPRRILINQKQWNKYRPK